MGSGGAKRRPRRRPPAARPGDAGHTPSGSGASVLRHLIGDDETIPPDRGLFLERTFRLHPDVCGYISEEFYEGRLEPAPVAAERTTPFGTGLRYLPVEHDGNRQQSQEEVEVVKAEVERLLAAGSAGGRDHGRLAVQHAGERAARGVAEARCASAPSTSSRARRRQSSSTRWRARVATTFRADSSSCSPATGSTSRSPERAASPTSSRARACSEVNARTIAQMRLANALCRFVELASES